jgi:hypothetical protein
MQLRNRPIIFMALESGVCFNFRGGSLAFVPPSPRAEFSAAPPGPVMNLTCRISLGVKPGTHPTHQTCTHVCYFSFA